jgi:hypothetical protein
MDESGRLQVPFVSVPGLAFWRLLRDNTLPRVTVLVRGRHATFVPPYHIARKVEPYLQNLYGPSKYWHDCGW